jgi:hypothetical protein
MVPWKKTFIAALAATIVGTGATGAALAASGRHSGNDRGVDISQPAVLDSHGSGISDDGNGLGHQNEGTEAGDDNSNSGPSDNQGPGENSGSEDDGGNSDHDGDGDDGGGQGGNSGSDG